ncbi:hypothetical protein [Streptomyces hygroscopicus]|nr:hypothetical protein [Streptomyces hygroscopicus]
MLFRAVFRDEVSEVGVAYSRGVFVQGLFSFMAGRRRSRACDSLLADS